MVLIGDASGIGTPSEAFAIKAYADCAPVLIALAHGFPAVAVIRASHELALKILVTRTKPYAFLIRIVLNEMDVSVLFHWEGENDLKAFAAVSTAIKPGIVISVGIKCIFSEENCSVGSDANTLMPRLIAEVARETVQYFSCFMIYNVGASFSGDENITVAKRQKVVYALAKKLS